MHAHLNNIANDFISCTLPALIALQLDYAAQFCLEHKFRRFPFYFYFLIIATMLDFECSEVEGEKEKR